MNFFVFFYLVHGEWSGWGTVEECKQPCSGHRYSIRRRFCDSPKPKYGGEFCHGNDTRKIPCAGRICKSKILIYSVAMNTHIWSNVFFYMINDFRNTRILALHGCLFN